MKFIFPPSVYPPCIRDRRTSYFRSEITKVRSIGCSLIFTRLLHISSFCNSVPFLTIVKIDTVKVRDGALGLSCFVNFIRERICRKGEGGLIHGKFVGL